MNCMDQLCLFDMILPDIVNAVCCMDSSEKIARKVEKWMSKLVADGEYFVNVDEHPLILRPVDVQPEDIRSGHHYYHYLIDGKVYAGIFVGRECE